MSAAEPLIDYLKQLQAKGQSHVQLDTKARQILRKFYIRATQGEEALNRLEKPSKKTSPVTKTQVSDLSEMQGASLDEKFVKLKRATLNHSAFKELNSLRSQLVFPPAPKETNIMFIGESPGYHEEVKGVPFAGPAGQKFDGLLKAMNLTRDNVHFTTILKFRPGAENQTTNTRPATKLELEAARQLIDQEIKMISPKVIVSFGATSAQFFTGLNAQLDDIRETSHAYLGIKLIPTYHPSFLLHTQETQDKRKVWEDMLEVMKLVGLPISAKQQGYYAPQ